MKQYPYIGFLLLLLLSKSALSQHLISGTLLDTNRKALELVNIKLVETNQLAVSDAQGKFQIPVKNVPGTRFQLEFSIIGYQRYTKKLVLSAGANTDIGVVTLKELNLSLETIEINASRNEEAASNSSLIISRDIIERTPALSLSDLLQQIPNRKIAPPSLQNVQSITLRSTFAPTTNNRGAFELNNAFGVAIIMDGNAISNNMNMQSFNPGLSGMSNSNLSSASSYGLNGSRSTSYSGDFAFGGTDLRQIPAENIESIEVISGVAPAKYGDLSDGAIILERQAGKTPGFLRMQLRDNASSYGYSQGFLLSPKAGALNVGLNYVNSFADNRDKIKAYRRMNGSLLHSLVFGKARQLKNTLSIDYGRNLDGIKSDPDDITRSAVRFDSWNFSLANRSAYRLNTRFLKNISLNLRYAEGHQVSYREQHRNEAYTIISDATSSGIHEGSYVPGIYTAQSLIDGRPINATAKLDLTATAQTGHITHFMSFGLSYDYGANKGLGQVFDPNRPRAATAMTNTSLSTNRSERYYDFSLAVAQQNVGAYIEDTFTLPLFKRNLHIRSGLRYDIQNALPSFSPRINANYALSSHIKLGFAYGIAFKSPSLAQRYPGPVYTEIALLNAYNGKAAESTYLVYVNRYDPDSRHLKSSQSQTLEFTAQWRVKDYALSLAAFNKQSRNGINTVLQRQYITLPAYTAIPVPGQKPQVIQNGSRDYSFSYSVFMNDLRSDNDGIEIIFTSPKIAPLSTSFNLSGGIFRTQYRSNRPRQENFNDVGTASPDYAVVGIYQPTHYTSYLSNATLSATTHLPKISFIVSFIADFSLMQKTIQPPTAGIPLAYLTRDGRYIRLEHPEAGNPDYGHLIKPLSQINENNIPRIIPNFHLNLAKEIKQRFRFAFNVYNVFNYQPYFISSTNQYTFPNSAPTFGAEIAVKL